MLFGALFSSYVLLRVGAADGTWSMGLMDIIVGAGNTMVLIASSMFVVLAWAKLKQGDLAGYKKWKWATVGCAILFLIVKWSYEWPTKFKHYDVWFKDSAVLYAKVNEGYTTEAGKNSENLRDEFDKEASLAKLHLRNEIYVKRFFKSASTASRDAFDTAWDSGTLALSGYINAYEDALINLEVNDWKAGEGLSEAEADKALLELDASNPAELRTKGGLVLKEVSYDEAKIAQYKLTKAGYAVSLSVVDYKTVNERPYFWRTKRVNEDIGGKPRVRSIIFELDKSGENKIKIQSSEIKRLNSYEPKHSTFFGIYYTITALHAAHVFGGIVVMLYNLLPIGLATWYRDREQFANRIESFGLFWHFVDLVWIFLFPILYIL